MRAEEWTGPDQELGTWPHMRQHANACGEGAGQAETPAQGWIPPGYGPGPMGTWCRP